MRSSNANDLKSTELQTREQAQNVIRLLRLFILPMVLMAALEFFFASRLGIWQLRAAALSLTVFIGVTIGAYRVARSGRPVLGIWSFLVALVVVWVVVTTFFLANVGFVLGLSLLITIPYIASRTLPEKQVLWAIGLSGVGFLLGLLGELYGVDSRHSFPALERILPVVTVLTGLVYIFYISRQFSRFTLRMKFIVAAIALVSATVIVLTFFISRNTRASIVEATGQRLSSVSSAHGLLVGELVGRQVNSLLTLSENQGIQQNLFDANMSYEGSDADIQQQIDELDANWQSSEESDPLPQSRLDNAVADELLEYQTLNSSNISLIVTDLHGGLVGTTDMVNQYDYSEEIWWQTAFNDARGATYISPPEVDQETDIFQLTIAVPIIDEDSGNAVGVLRSIYSLRELSDILFSAQQEFGESTQVNLFLPPNKLINIEGTEVEETLSAETLTSLEINLNEDFGQFNFDGVLNLVSQANVNTLLHFPEVDTLGWRIVTHQPLTDTLVPVREQQRTFIILGVVVLLATSIGAGLLSQSFARPIINLTEAAVQVSEGNLAIQARIETQDETGTLAKAFNEMTARLRQTIALQEQRISERTRALEVSSEVSRRLSTILDKQTLINEMVYQVQVAFNYYHAHIYLFDEKEDYLVLVGGTGKAGQQMLKMGHSIPKGKGLVGRAAVSRSAVLVRDVNEAPNWLPNPLLPETVSEAAVPILAGENVLGVLDVQHNVRFVMKQEDVELLQSIANQVAIALQNAEAYRRAQKQAQREALINDIAQKIQTTTTVDLALKTAAREIGQALSASQTVVKLKNGAGNSHQSEPDKKRSE